MENRKFDLKEIDAQPSVGEAVQDMPESSVRSLPRPRDRYINKVPQLLREAKPGDYTPRTVAVGPLHKPVHSSADDPSKRLEDEKKDYIGAFVLRTRKNLQEFIPRIQEQRDHIMTNYYPQYVATRFDSNELAQILLDDSCFLIEHFLQTFEQESEDDSSPLASWEELAILCDLLLYENQVPYYLIEELYKFAVAGRNDNDPPFIELTCFYFQKYNVQNIHHEDVGHPRQFVELLRTFLLPQSFRSGSVPLAKTKLPAVPKASTLSKEELVFEVIRNKSFLEVDFQDGVLRMGEFVVDASTERHLRNIVAWEQCTCPGTAYVTQYLMLLKSLVRTEKDADVLIDNKIIDDGLKSSATIVEMLRSLTLDPMVLNTNSKYLTLAQDLNYFHESRKDKYKSTFKREHCNALWEPVAFILGWMVPFDVAFNVIRSFISWMSKEVL